MQVHPGVFVSNTSTEEWRPDPEIGGGAEEHVLIDTGAMRAGLSRFASDADPQPPPWVLPQTQILLVLEGGARIDIEDGPTLELGPGDMASLPKGAVTRWHLAFAVQGDVGARVNAAVTRSEQTLARALRTATKYSRHGEVCRVHARLVGDIPAVVHHPRRL